LPSIECLGPKTVERVLHSTEHTISKGGFLLDRAVAKGLDRPLRGPSENCCSFTDDAGISNQGNMKWLMPELSSKGII
jgi:hypothetical protein